MKEKKALRKKIEKEVVVEIDKIFLKHNVEAVLQKSKKAKFLIKQLVKKFGKSLKIADSKNATTIKGIASVERKPLKKKSPVRSRR